MNPFLLCFSVMAACVAIAYYVSGRLTYGPLRWNMDPKDLERLAHMRLNPIMCEMLVDSTFHPGYVAIHLTDVVNRLGERGDEWYLPFSPAARAVRARQRELVEQQESLA